VTVIVAVPHDLIEAPPVAIAGTLSSIESVNAALRPLRWAIVEASVITTTGFARIIAERREGGRGVKVTLLRSTFGAPVLEMRDVTEKLPGMYRDFWTVVDGGHLGRRSHEGIRTALRCLANYIEDNSHVPRLTARKAVAALAQEAGTKGDPS
jgi:hypothetical protein